MVTDARGALATSLYELVDAYASLGDHRTGTEVDDATREWFAGELRARGASVRSIPYSFDRYDARAHVEIGGRAVDALPVFYAGTGALETSTPFVAEMDPMRALGTHLEELEREARDAGAAAAVFATRHTDGRLVAMNRRPVVTAGPLAALVAGSELDALLAGPVHAAIEARVVPGRSATVVGTWGASTRRQPVVVATPLSGWFACAGERGTGIAIALEVAASLAREVPVVVVGTTGHELEHLGVRAFLGAREVAPCAVVHLGASLAAGDRVGDGQIALSVLRFAFAAGVDDDLFGALGRALEPGSYSLNRDVPRWPGEGEEWRSLGAPVVSFVGGFERFHTPDDVTAAVTSVALLERVHLAVHSACSRMVEVLG